MNRRTRLLILQPYIPEYRVPLFRRLRMDLDTHGIDLALATGAPQGNAVLRDDDWSGSESQFRLRQRSLQVGHRTILVRSARDALQVFRPDMVIVEQAIKNLETYSLFGRRLIKSGPSVAMWGQGRSFSTPQPPAAARLKMALTRLSDWFFAYTQQGANYVIKGGFSPERVTVLRNSIDTQQLQSLLQAVSPEDLRLFQARLGLDPERTALFLGGVDDRKGIDFLLQAAVATAKKCPGFVLLVGGTGDLAARVTQIQAIGGPVRYLGRVDGRDKALAIRCARVLLVPEWVGLVSVDSLVAGCPLITTNHPSHSPEFSYLQNGSNSVVTGHSISEYSQAIADLLGDEPRLRRLSAQALADSREVSMEHMVSAYSAGVLRWREYIIGKLQ